MVYPISRIIIPSIYKLWLRKIEGIDNIPKGKPFIIAANHSSYFETLLLPAIVAPKVNKKVHALVNSYYWDNFFTRFFLDIWECIPVFVENEKSYKGKNMAAFEKAMNYLRNKELVMIFPEGRRSDDGKLQKAYTGIARLALLSKAPVLPIGVIDSHKVMPKGRLFPRFARCEVNIGKPMYFEKYYDRKINENMLQEVTRSIMKEIAKLIKQKYNY